MKNRIIATGTALLAGATGINSAAAGDWTVSGLLRQEFAVQTGSDNNLNNLQANSFNGVPVANTGLYAGLVPTLMRPAAQRQDNDFNLFSSRLELNLDGRLSEYWTVHFKLRGVADLVGQVDDAFDGRNIFEQEFHRSQRGNLTELTGRDWMLDLPVAYADFNSGPLWLRLGNQQIAWGEALFFRVSDLPNGLDLRRHSLFGVIAEEYADARVPALGLRGSLRLNESWDIEGFAQKFQPSILPGPNSPYNTVPAQFTVHEQEGFDAVDDDWNLGLRLRGEFAGLGLQLFAVRRNNPDGVYKWTTAAGPGALPGTAFEAGVGTGVYSTAEWFEYASHARLDGIGALNVVLNEFPGTVALGANMVAAACGAPSAAIGAVAVDRPSAACILDTFFTGGDLRGHIRRDYPRETIFGLAVNHVFSGAPDSLLDQLIGRFEISHALDRSFTNPTLSQVYIEKDETQFALILEKYHKFSSAIPATYLVLQWLHKSDSDLFGRALEGLSNTPGASPVGQDSFNALAFALQQPSPTLAWRFDLSLLTDLRGGWLVQPGVRWKPSREFQLDVYANVIESATSRSARNFVQGLEYANELFVRGTYSF